MKLGVFDSGLGGLTVVKAIRALAPQIDICYLGDTARVPYGGKSAETIVRYAFECSRFLISQNVDAIVVACNSASAVALTFLQEQFRVPVYGVIEPGARAALGYARVGLLATVATVQSGAYERELQKLGNSILFSMPAPLLVPLVEDGWSLGNVEEEVVTETVKHYLEPLVRSKVEVIILGCTHYPILRPVIEAELKRLGLSVSLIDSGEELAKDLVAQGLLNSAVTTTQSGRLEIFSTDDPVSFRNIAETVLDVSLSSLSVARVEI